MKNFLRSCFFVLVLLTVRAHAAPTLAGDLVVQRTLTLQGTLSPSQITGNVNDYAPTNFSTAFALRLSTSASWNITGLAGGADGRTLFVYNVGSNDLVLKAEDSGSTAANRFALSADVTMTANTSVILRYDSTSSRWRVVSGVVTSGGGGGGSGDVVGPSSSTDNAIVRYDGTTGKLVQNSGVTISDTNDLTTTGTAQAARIGVGVTPDANNLIEAVAQASANRRIAGFKYYAADANGSLLSLRKGRGTFASPVVVNSGDELGSLSFEGYYNSATPNDDVGASVSAVTTESWSGTSARGAAIVFKNILTGATTFAERMRLSGNGNLLVGTTSDAGVSGAGNIRLSGEVQTESDTSAWFTARRSSSSAASDSGLLVLGRSRGTVASRSNILSGDAVGGILFQGYGGSTWQNAASIGYTATENWTTTFGGYMPFVTTITGGSAAERMRLSGNGNLLVGTTSDTGLTGSGNLKVNAAINAGGDVVTGSSALGWAGWSSLSGRGLYAQKDGTAGVSLLAAGGSASSSFFGSHAGGTVAGGLTQSSSGQGTVFGTGAYDGTNWFTGSRIQMLAAEAPTASVRGHYMVFDTILSGATTLAERMRLSSAGNLLIGTGADGSLSGSGGLRVASTTASTSTGTGGAVFDGGIGVAGNSTFGGTISSLGDHLRTSNSSYYTYQAAAGSFTGRGFYSQHESSNPGFFAYRAGGAPGVARFDGAVSAGTFASPTATTSDFATYLSFRGYDVTNGWRTSSDAEIQLAANETFTNTAHGTKIVFRTNPAGSTTLATQATLTSSAFNINPVLTAGTSSATGVIGDFNGSSTSDNSIRLISQGYAALSMGVNKSGSTNALGAADARMYLGSANAVPLVLTSNAVSALQIQGTVVDALVPLYSIASATTGAGFRLPHGSAPTSPTNGDVWTTTAGMYVRVNGTTIGPLTSTTPDSFIDAFRKRPYLYTDFYHLDQALTGEFYSAAINSGTINASSRVSSDHPGVVMLKSAGANSGYFLGTRHTASTTSAIFVLGGSECFELVFNLDTLTNATMRMGFGGANSISDFADGAYLEINSSGVCTGKTAASSSRSSTSTTYTASTNTWYRLKILTNSNASTVTYSLLNMSGSQLWTDSLSTNIPTNPVGLCVNAWESAGASQNLIHLDWLAMYYLRDLTR